MSGHTPGPWTATLGDGRFVIWAADGERVGTAEGRDHDTDEANALVLAAAPRLLEACEVLCEAVDEGDLGRLRDIATGVRALAITEATGGAS